MTRDEAIEIMSHIWGGSPQHGLAKRYVDAFVALGMLNVGLCLESERSSESEEISMTREQAIAFYSQPGRIDPAAWEFIAPGSVPDPVRWTDILVAMRLIHIDGGEA